MADTAPSLAERRSVKWFKSSYSGGEGNECVEVADRCSWVGVRDSKSPRKSLSLSKTRSPRSSQICRRPGPATPTHRDRQELRTRGPDGRCATPLPG
ncbi:DUF397 domain-containing protein [Streptomyces coelicoflavus]|uniref:DUF397 domain-containing protein n=1 Tax=Streptomyces TaxID=1883 RepID=UPI001291C4D5|nr:DUF397 domain-containing protein [Streptomyces sp. SYP-A7193]